jgi:hypothetical protein
MKTNFVIQSGNLSFKDNYILINDNNNKWTGFSVLFGSLGMLLYGIFIIIEHFSIKDHHDLWPGMACIILGIPSLIYRLRTNYDKRIDYSKIKKVIIKHNLTNFLIAGFIFDNATNRRVILDQNDFDKFEKLSLEEFLKTLNDKNIKTEIK